MLITESTYATTIRDSKRCRERDLLRQVSECVQVSALIHIYKLQLCIQALYVYIHAHTRMTLKYYNTIWRSLNESIPCHSKASLQEGVTGA